MPHDLPPGFRPHNGKRRPPDKDTRWCIVLGNGFYSTEQSYTRDQINWIWADPNHPHSGDVTGYREA